MEGTVKARIHYTAIEVGQLEGMVKARIHYTAIELGQLEGTVKAFIRKLRMIHRVNIHYSCKTHGHTIFEDKQRLLTMLYALTSSVMILEVTCYFVFYIEIS